MPEVKQTQQPKDEPEFGSETPFDWNEVVRRSQKIPTILPKLVVGEKNGSFEIVTFQEKQPRVVAWTKKDPKTKQEVDASFPVINVAKDDGTKHTLGVGAVSLQNDLGKIFKEHGTLEGVRVKIERYEYKHKEWGATSALRCTELPKLSSQQ